MVLSPQILLHFAPALANATEASSIRFVCLNDAIHLPSTEWKPRNSFIELWIHPKRYNPAITANTHSSSRTNQYRPSTLAFHSIPTAIIVLSKIQCIKYIYIVSATQIYAQGIFNFCPAYNSLPFGSNDFSYFIRRWQWRMWHRS